MRKVKHWNRLPREVVQFPSLEIFNTRAEEDLSNPV